MELFKKPFFPIKMSELITGNLEVDFEILKNLEYVDLLSTFKTNKLASTYLNFEPFWHKMILFWHPDKEKYKPANSSFKEFWQIILNYPLEDKDSPRKSLLHKDLNAFLYLSNFMNMRWWSEVEVIFKMMGTFPDEPQPFLRVYNGSPDIFIKIYELLDIDKRSSFYEWLFDILWISNPFTKNKQVQRSMENFCYKLLMKLTELGYFMTDRNKDLLWNYEILIEKLSKPQYLRWMKLAFSKGFVFDQKMLDLCFTFLDWEFIDQIMEKFQLAPTNSLYDFILDPTLDLIKEIIGRFNVLPDNEYKYRMLEDLNDTEIVAYLDTLDLPSP